VYALLCRVRPVGSTEPRRWADIKEAVAARELRTAYDLLRAQQGLTVEQAEVRQNLAADLGEIDAGSPRRRSLRPTARRRAPGATSTCCARPASPRPRRGCAAVGEGAPGERPRAGRLGDGAVRASDHTYRVERRMDAGPHAGRTVLLTTRQDPRGFPMDHDMLSWFDW
jgi:hypothetical protein